MTPIIQQCDTTHIDTISRYIADSVTLQALNNSQEFYSDAFNKLQDTFGLHLTMIAIIVTLITIIVATVQIVFFIYSEKKLKENDTRLKDIERDVNERNEELKETDKLFKDIEQNFNKRDKEFNEKNKKYDERVLYFFFSIAYNFAMFAKITAQENVDNFFTATRDFLNELLESLYFSDKVLNWIKQISQIIRENPSAKNHLLKIAKPIEKIIEKLNSMENTDCNLKVKEELQRLSAFIKDK